MSTRSTGSIITSARKRCRTSWCCALPMACSSRSGIETISTTSRSPSMKGSASAIAAIFTIPPARCAKRTEIAIKFKQAQFAMFRDTPVDRLSQNFMIISTEPTEGIELQFNTKVPGPTINIDGVEMKFRYKDYFKAEPSTGYETLIYDCMIGDNILFQRADSVEAGWQAVQPFLDAWKKAGAQGLESYKAGSEGPAEANDLLERDGRSWRKLG